MAPKDDKAPEAAKTEAPKDDKVTPAKVSPEVKALAERIFIQMCIHASSNFAERKYVANAYKLAGAFVAYEPPAE